MAVLTLMNVLRITVITTRSVSTASGASIANVTQDLLGMEQVVATENALMKLVLLMSVVFHRIPMRVSAKKDLIVTSRAYALI